MKKCIMLILAAVILAAASIALANVKNDGGLNATISVNGSTSMEKVIGILAEQFMEDHKGVTVTYDATGSGTGIESASNGTCDIGLASRNLRESETAKGLAATTIALDGIALIVSENCPVNDLTVEQIAALFTGDVKDWSAFGGKGDIACIGREAGSGTRDGFESITKTADKCKLTQELTSTGAVIAAVQSSPNAIGYVSFASVTGQRGIKVLTVEGVACTADNIRDGSYLIQRPFNLVTKSSGAPSETAREFIAYMTGRGAAELIIKAGAVPTAR